MKKLSTNEIRRIWLDFFKSKEHHYLETVSLVPINDPSILWINSGVATLKPYFDGRLVPPSPRLTNSQKAIRTNDIENVGITARHHTMFEMLGNFSIGNYFKVDALKYAWELLTSADYFAIPKEKLYITVFEEDEEAYNIWTQTLGIEKSHIFSLSKKTNFWDIGQGPCGPNTEIFYDRGEVWDPQQIGTRLLSEDLENDRYIEIWNIVFSQFNNDGNNNYSDLPRKNIDTGAGLERLASIFQNTPTNFETDIFWPIIKDIEKLTPQDFKYSIDNYYNEDSQQTKINISFKVIADHLRAAVFAIADGVLPSNKDRGYIVRRLIRRSIIHARKLQIKEDFLFKLVKTVIEVMKDFYPYLINQEAEIKRVIKIEENKFSKTLSKGYELLEKIIVIEKSVSGKNALLLFESFGFPIEQIIEICNEKQVPVDLKNFKVLLESVKQKAREARKNVSAWNIQETLFSSLNLDSKFVGWETLSNSAKVIFLADEKKELKKVSNQRAFLILDQTPFYAEKGGQASDNGTIVGKNFTAEVIDVQQLAGGDYLHKVIVNGDINLNDKVDTFVNQEKRFYTMKNHSGTHLVHAALRVVLGDSLMQSGSYNDENFLRMDFNFNSAISKSQLNQVEELVLNKISEKITTEVHFCNLKEAVEKYHALAFFADKYDEIVRVVKFGNFSSELCGGTHVHNTSEVENFIITSLESKGNGIFRIKCLTSNKTVYDYLEQQFLDFQTEIDIIKNKYFKTKNLVQDSELENLLNETSKLESSRDNLEIFKVKINDSKNLFKKYDKKLQAFIVQEKISKYKTCTPKINKSGVQEINLNVEGLNFKELKELSDYFKNKYQHTIIILIGKFEKDTFVMVNVSQDLTFAHSAIEIFKNLPNLKVKGGGSVTFAQGKVID